MRAQNSKYLVKPTNAKKKDYTQFLAKKAKEISCDLQFVNVQRRNKYELLFQELHTDNYQRLKWIRADTSKGI